MKEGHRRVKADAAMLHANECKSAITTQLQVVEAQEKGGMNPEIWQSTHLNLRFPPQKKESLIYVFSSFNKRNWQYKKSVDHNKQKS